MVRRFFNSETGIWRFFGWVGDIVMLSLLWVLCSVPLVTMGAASTALYDAAVHVMRRKDDAAIADSSAPHRTDRWSRPGV